MYRSSWGRVTALAAAGALSVSTLAVSTLAGTPSYAADPAPSAATWLTGQLTNGVVHNGQFNFDDIALTADVGFALTTIGGNDAAVAQIAGAVEPRAKGEWYTSTFGGTTTTYGGSVGKTAAFAQAVGKDPRAFGGENLIARIEALTGAAAPIAGRVQDENNSFGDANTIGQAFAVRALTKAGSPRAADATAFLLKQQCTAGYFRLNFAADKTAAAQGCVDGDTAGSAAHPDATTNAVLQLSAAGNSDPAVKTAIEKATAWLKSQQKADGSLGGGVTTEASNANTTGLAAAVFAGQGDCLAAGKAANWVRALQVPAGTAGALAPSVGAVAYDQASYDAAKAGGITTGTADQWRRATAQAAAGLAATLSPTISNVTGPRSFVRAGSKQQIVLNGVTAGDNVCFSDNGAAVKAFKATSAPFTHTVTLPANTGDATYRFTAVDGEKSFTIKALAKLKIKTKLKKRVKLGKKQVVRLKGLVKGERVKVKVNGKLVKKGKAKADGTFKAKFKVTKALAKNRKKAKVVVKGHFGNRGNVKQFTVLPPAKAKR